MKTLIRSFGTVLALLLLSAIPAFAQTTTTQTTISANVTATQTTIPLTSTTNVSANGNLYIDREYMAVTSVNTTALTAQVIRGMSGTVATTHISGTNVWVATAAQTPYVFRSYDKAGSCTAANELFLPQINIITGVAQNCNAAALTAGVVSSAFWGGALNAAPFSTGWPVTVVSNANYTTSAATDTMIVYQTLTANRTVVVAASSVPGRILMIANAANNAFLVNVTGLIAGSTTFSVATGNALRLAWTGASWFVW